MAMTQRQKRRHDHIGDEPLGKEQRHDIDASTSTSFVRGSSLWMTVLPGKYWPSVISFSMFAAPPFSTAREAGLRLLHGVDGGVDVHAQLLQPVGTPASSAARQGPWPRSSSAWAKTSGGVPSMADVPVVHDDEAVDVAGDLLHASG